MPCHRINSPQVAEQALKALEELQAQKESAEQELRDELQGAKDAKQVRTETAWAPCSTGARRQARKPGRAAGCLQSTCQMPVEWVRPPKRAHTIHASTQSAPPTHLNRPQSLKDQLKAMKEELIDARGQIDILETARAALEAREAAHEGERKEAAARVKEAQAQADAMRKALEVRMGHAP